MADIEVFLDTNEKIAHHPGDGAGPGTKATLRMVADRVAANARMLLDTLPEERTGASYVEVDSGKLDAYVYLVDRNPDKTSDKIAAIISYQHNILWNALAVGVLK